jgi:dTDP-4-amino-4,6-dideoxygalactose transaminase
MHRYTGSEINGYAMVFWHDGPNTRALSHQLADRGIQSDTVRYDYKPLYRETAFTAHARQCPNAEQLIDSILTIPCHEGLTQSNINEIADTVKDVFTATILSEQTL